MASPDHPPPSDPGHAGAAAPSLPQSASGRYRSRRLSLRFQIDLFLPKDGIPPKKVLVHASWITALGLVLLRLAAAISSENDAKAFAIAGVAITSLPWLLLFLTTAAITALFEAGVYDLTWVFSGTAGGGPTPRKPLRIFRQGDELDEDRESNRDRDLVGGSQTETSSATAHETSDSLVAPSSASTVEEVEASTVLPTSPLDTPPSTGTEARSCAAESRV